MRWTPWRQHVRRDGKAKVRYETLHAAQAIAQRDGGGCYQCGLCGYWHVTHRAPARRRVS